MYELFYNTYAVIQNQNNHDWYMFSIEISQNNEKISLGRKIKFRSHRDIYVPHCNNKSSRDNLNLIVKRDSRVHFTNRKSTKKLEIKFKC